MLVYTPQRDQQVDSPSVKYTLRQCKWIRLPWDYSGMENPISPSLGWRILHSDYDVLHAHSHLFFTSVMAILLNRIKQKPSVLTIHGVRAVRQSSVNLFQELWMQFLGRYLFRLVDQIICLTPADAEEISRYGVPAEKIKVIPNGINTHLFQPQVMHDDYMLWVGRFVAEKGLTYLVDAMEQVVKAYPDAHMILVGDGPRKNEIIERIKDKGLEEHFKFKSNCPQSEIAKLMAGCEMFILPSLQEGFPKSLLEAMACGRAVITTQSLADIVRDAGITVKPRSVEQLHQAMLAYLTDPAKREEAGERGRSYVEQNWSWDVITQQINGVYEDLVQGK